MSTLPLLLPGRRVWFGSVCGLSTPAVTCGMVICLRHFPTCMTSGMLSPDGAFGMTNLPWVSVSTEAMGEPDAGA